MKRWALVLLVVVVALAGCGDDDVTPMASTTASTAPPETTASGAPVGTEFTDPQGTYTLTVARSWTAGPAANEVENWFLGDQVNGFAPNVNVVTQPVPGMDLAGYIDSNVQNLSGFTLLDHEIVDGTFGQQLGVLEYEGAPTGTTLHAYGVIAVAHDQAVIATLTATPDTFEALLVKVFPYLLTLQIV